MKRLTSIGMLALAAHAAGAQQLAARIAATRDGTVRFTYAARSGVCGDGRDVVRIGDVTYVSDGEQTYRGSSMERCDFGAVRAEIVRSGIYARPPGVPVCAVHMDEAALGVTRDEAVLRLREAHPAGAVGQCPDGLFVNPMTLMPGEERVVAEGLLAVLGQGR